ncbi:MAG: hypothetical protein H5U40_18010 [Polyangiaceae bacterium]|nr:hypothetical protein [Polyangiaceae bacterium]
MDPAPQPMLIEWFRTEPRLSLHGAILPAILCASFGWLLLALSGPMFTARPPHRMLSPRSTLPSVAIVDEQGDPFAATARPAREQAMALSGTLLVMVSPLLLVYRLRRRGRGETAELLLRSDALVHREGGDETLLPWGDLEEVRSTADAERPQIELVRHDGTELVIEARFVGASAAEIAARIRAIRGRALFGLLEPSSWPERSQDD